MNYFFRDKQLLLILDNFEHILSAAPSLASILSSCPQVKILVTSRALLNIGGEHEVAVSPLALPSLKYFPPLLLLSRYEAIAFFVQRVQAFKPAFQLTEENARDIAEICVRLDGLPLALELAAARARMLAPRELLRRLERSLAVLTGGGRDLHTRQQTLRNTIAWSYDLLTAEEQQLFRRFSVFTGSATLDDIESMCVALGESPDLVLDGMTALLGHNLVQLHEEATTSRFSQLQTIREYGQEKLSACGELEVTREAHASLYRPFIEEASNSLWANQGWLSRIEEDYENLYAALQYFRENRELATLWSLTTALSMFWFQRGRLGCRVYLDEAQRLHNFASQSGEPQESSLRGRAIHVLASIESCLGNDKLAETYGHRAVDLYREVQELAGIVHLSCFLAYLSMQKYEYDVASDYCKQALQLSRQSNDVYLGAALWQTAQLRIVLGEYSQAYLHLQEGIPILEQQGDLTFLYDAFWLMGQTCLYLGNYEEAHKYAEQSLTFAIERRLIRSIGMSKALLGEIALHQGDIPAASLLLKESLSEQKEGKDRTGVALSSALLAKLAVRRQNYDDALSLLEQSLEVAFLDGNTWTIARSLDQLASVAIKLGNPAWAARLGGTAEMLREKIGTPIPATEREDQKHMSETSRTLLGSKLFTAVWNEGRTLSPQEAFLARDVASTLAVDTAKEERETKISKPLPGGLTRRELDVLRLLATGQTNSQIADTLVLSTVTVNSYLRSIYSKLAVSSRTAALRYAIDHDLL